MSAASDAALGSTLFGGMIASAMYGVLICQTAWYYRAFPKDPAYLKILIAVLCVSETVGLVLDYRSLWYYFIQRGIGVDFMTLITCNYWAAAAFFIPTELTCFLTEILFIKRMWSCKFTFSFQIHSPSHLWNVVSKQRYFKIGFVVLAPFFVGWGFTINFVQNAQRYYCFPERKASNFSLLMSFGLRILSSGVVTGTMCLLLYQQASPLTTSRMIQTQRIISIVKSLIIGSLSTGLLMWLTALAFMISVSSALHPFGDDPKIFVASSTL
ncbi:uncharacterized protein LACBIDRAFT_297471 [Laccaria bicolor S238N-H82]|uniref:Predicted protein n=1 Tax=Laccaria bicolor (strain S238N-H82 / ATCC MYA-4686) TaxID=486041 RepID=B0DB93_LACBS|nr:uncharacterized protein LACBIDRAFT_297471 [Laccaria bicolor S238N-H82]EDR07947.1 predicted protein [Laccaria bicolor S238N-H82]|eukprot:XP_001881017.1 predicted protein [Laccaria bicolor S238N-H82]